MAKTANRWFKSQFLAVPPEKHSLGLGAGALALGRPNKQGRKKENLL
jgi:hypothetical protein